MMAPQDVPDGSASGNVHKSVYRKWWFWVLAVPFWLYVALLVYRAPFVIEKDRTQEAVAQIHAQKLTLADVNGENLPPLPDPAEVDATIEGVDANGNGIRDDVELAIFKKYPNSGKIRAAELQYAKALQMELTQVFNSETFVATAQETGRASGCIADLTSRDNLKVYLKNLKSYEKEVESLQFNTTPRISKRDANSEFLTSFGGLEGNRCDVDKVSMQN